MWIRSQGKLNLINCNEITIENKKIIGRATTDLRSYFLLGEYKTEERCIEVLDKIQELNQHIEEFKLGILGSSSFFEKHDSLIFQMPVE